MTVSRRRSATPARWTTAWCPPREQHPAGAAQVRREFAIATTAGLGSGGTGGRQRPETCTASYGLLWLKWDRRRLRLPERCLGR
jgi:hypothetical protein